MTSGDPPPEDVSGAEKLSSVSPAFANRVSISPTVLSVSFAISSRVLLNVPASNDPKAFSSSLTAKASVRILSAESFVASARSFLALICSSRAFF